MTETTPEGPTREPVMPVEPALPPASSRARVSAVRRALLVGVTAGATFALPAPAAQLEFPILPPAKNLRPVAAELRVELDGIPVPVRSLTQAAGSVVIWLDAPLIGPRGLETAVRSLTKEVDRLVGLGPVEVVLADPEPTLLAGPTRDEDRIEEALRQASQDAVAVGELAWLRQRYLAVSEHRAPGPGEAREAAGRETRLIQGQRSAMAHWLGEGRHERPGTLVLVSDGFDLEPRRFYLEAAGEIVPERSPPDPAQVELARSLAAGGWTVVALSLGQRQPELYDPSAALVEIADATRGLIVRRPKKLAAAFDRLDGRWLVTAETGRAPTTRPAPLVVESTRTERRLPAPLWGATDDALASFAKAQESQAVFVPQTDRDRPLISFLPPGPGLLTGPQRIETVTGRRRIGRVQFKLDEESVGEDTEPPFSVDLDLGDEPEAHTLEAFAFSRSGRELGSDTLTLNPVLDELRVEILEPRSDALGLTEIRAKIRTPRDRTLESVEFYRGEERIAVVRAPPYSTTLPSSEAGATDYLRVVAHLDDGTTQEDARLVEPSARADRIDVQLVELLAVVTRRRSAPAPLGAEDFTVIQGGEIQPIRQFASAAELPLTLGLAIDTSESMQSWINGARMAAARFLRGALREEDRAFLIHFDTSPKLAQAPSDVDTVVQRLGGLRPKGDTVLYDGVLFSLLQFDRLEGGRRALVILTDGKDEGSRFGPEDCLREATKRGVPIYFLALGAPPNPLRDPRPLGLSRLARRTGGRLFYLSSPDDLDPIYDRIVTELDSQYYLAYSTDRDLSSLDLRDLEVSVAGDDLEVRAVAAPKQPGG